MLTDKQVEENVAHMAQALAGAAESANRLDPMAFDPTCILPDYPTDPEGIRRFMGAYCRALRQGASKAEAERAARDAACPRDQVAAWHAANDARVAAHERNRRAREAESQRVAKEAEREGAYFAAVRRSHIPPEYQARSTELSPQVRAALARGGAYLFGDNGTYKTTTACGAAMAEMASGHYLDTFFVAETDLLDSYRKAAGSRVGSDEAREWAEMWRRARTCELLVLDDLGKSVPTPGGVVTLFSLLDTRAAFKLPSIVTSNYAIEDQTLGVDLLRRLSQRGEGVTASAICSRLRALRSFALAGDDQRRQK